MLEHSSRITGEREFDPTYTGSRQERVYLRGALGGFYEDRLFDDILYQVKGGKEATVYCLAAGPTAGVPLLAAKVFRPLMFRAMKNDSLYKTGRQLRSAQGKIADTRTERALRKRTGYGRRLDSASWCKWEYDALAELHAAGADVPRPVACSHNAILMEFVGDEHGAAPILSSLRLPPDEARVAFDRLIENVEIMLSRLIIHADLSAYNVMYREGDPKIIDFPQTVDAIRHPQAYELFTRDVDRLCGYFERQGVPTDASALAIDLWGRYVGYCAEGSPAFE